MPQNVLDAYIRFQEDLQTHNTTPGGLGEAYERRCCIPQGDPFSIIIMAICMRPWVKLMEHHKSVPRVLADDMLILIHGKEHVQQFQHNLKATHQDLNDIGRNNAPEKSANCSNEDIAREWYRTHKWVTVGATIPANKSIRELGSNLSTANITRSSTFNERLQQATSPLMQLCWLPMAFPSRAKAIRTYEHPKAPYGCEATRPSPKDMNAYSSQGAY